MSASSICIRNTGKNARLRAVAVHEHALGRRAEGRPEVAHALRDQYGTSTTEGAIGGGTIGGWIAQALRMRPRLVEHPAGLI